MAISKYKVKNSHLITYSDAESKVSDEFRTIRTNIRFLTEKLRENVFVVTSPGTGEGKSTTTANLAVSMAQQKEKVLLIDANLREPSIHSVFHIANDIGLTDVLTGQENLKEAVIKTGVGELDILTSGFTANNPAELLGSPLMFDLLVNVADYYDVVLIDSPAVLQTTETRILANRSNGVVLVLNRGRTTLEEALEARKILDLAHANLIGVILTEK